MDFISTSLFRKIPEDPYLVPRINRAFYFFSVRFIQSTKYKSIVTMSSNRHYIAGKKLLPVVITHKKMETSFNAECSVIYIKKLSFKIYFPEVAYPFMTLI